VNEAWALICEIGFWGWVMMALALALTSFQYDGGFDITGARKFAIPLSVLYLVWVLGMLNA
jgi:hypothetical protein